MKSVERHARAKERIENVRDWLHSNRSRLVEVARETGLSYSHLKQFEDGRIVNGNALPFLILESYADENR